MVRFNGIIYKVGMKQFRTPTSGLPVTRKEPVFGFLPHSSVALAARRAGIVMVLLLDVSSFSMRNA